MGKAGDRAARHVRHRQGRAPGYLVTPEPDSPFQTTAELHNRLTEDLGRRRISSCIAVLAVSLPVLVLAVLVVKFLADMSHAP